MAEDKRIRVSADATPLQELRQGAQTLWNDLTQMETRFKGLAEQTIGTIQRQIDLLKERNRVASDFTLGTGNVNTPGHVRIIEPGTTPGQPYRSPFGPNVTHDGNSVSNRILEAVNRIADTLESNFRNQQNGILPNTGGGGGDTLNPPVNNKPGQGGGGIGLGMGGFRIPTSISGLMGLLPAGALLMAIGSIFGKQAQFGATQYGAENEFQRRNNIGNHWLINGLTFGISGAEAQKREVARMASAQNDQSLRSYTSLFGTSYRDAVLQQLRGSFTQGFEYHAAIPTGVDMSPDQQDAYAAAGLFDMATGNNLKKQVYDYNQVPGELRVRSSNPDEYHTWASRTLGMDVSEYLTKATTLQRAGVYSRNTSDYAINQALMAQRMRGLSDEDLSSVFRTTRFDRSGRTGSDVIRTFDTNLRNLSRGMDPLAQQQFIASTLPEYLNQFNNISESVLSKTGSINSANIMRSMTGIQNATGMEGRQLNRMQEALMGVNVAQDDVSQALLLRAARELNPDATFSELQAYIEDMPNQPKLQERLLSNMEKMTGGGEMMRHTMKAMFPGLSMTDIVDFTKGNKTAEEIFQGINKGGEYDDTEVAKTVGPQELSNAGTRNRKIVDGVKQTLGESALSLKEALESLEKPVPVSIMKSDKPESGYVYPGLDFQATLPNFLDNIYGVLQDILKEQKKPIEIPYQP